MGKQAKARQARKLVRAGHEEDGLALAQRAGLSAHSLDPRRDATPLGRIILEGGRMPAYAGQGDVKALQQEADKIARDLRAAGYLAREPGV